MIPIFDSQGRAIAFGSRTLGNEQPKYLNSPDTPLFEKEKLSLLSMRAKQAIIQQDLAIVVEGYFDAIAPCCGITKCGCLSRNSVKSRAN
jgi:DNA primase